MKIMNKEKEKGRKRKIDLLYPIPKERVLVYKDGKNEEGKIGLVIADLHLGIEAEFAKSGVHVRSRTNELLEHILSIVKEHKVEYVIFLGDVKHNIPGASAQEYGEIPAFFDELLEGTKEVHIVKGNHDGGIEHIVPKGVKVHGSEGFVWEGLGLFHGHTWPSENVMRAKVVLMAHIHPKVKLYEGRFSFVTEPCWLRGKWRGLAKGLAKSMGNELGNGLVKGLGKKRYENVDLDADVIVMPAYNEYLGGSAVNDTCNKLIGPVLANGLFDLENASVYLLDGTYLGEVGSLIMKNDK